MSKEQKLFDREFRKLLKLRELIISEIYLIRHSASAFGVIRIISGHNLFLF